MLHRLNLQSPTLDGPKNMDTSGQAANERTRSVLEEIYRTETIAEDSPARRRPRVRRRLDWDRIAAPLAIAVAFLALTVGAAQMRSNIHFPTAGLKAIRPLGLRDLQPRFDWSLPAAGSTDTDGDGLSDADETTTYGSSPYLEDTDSDGTSDGDEVKAKTDPACPAGQTCGVGTGPSGPPTAAPSPAVPALPGNPSAIFGPTPDIGAAASGGGAVFSAAKIREQLIAAGVSADLISGFSDPQLASVYQEVITQTNLGAAVAGGTGLPPAKGQLTATGLRPLLREAGLSQEALDQLTDQQLEELMSEVIREENLGP